MVHLLDNPAWSALTTAQSDFAVGDATAKRYRQGVLPFAAMASAGRASDGDAQSAGLDARAAGLDALYGSGESFFLIGELPALPSQWTLELDLPCAQLLAPEDISMLPAVHNEIISLGEADKGEMYELVDRVQPGYYLPDTPSLGQYVGIRVDGRLVAMAGERMRLTGFSELSAVCTLPEYTGLGYAQQLMIQLMRRQTAAGIIPFLHVSLANQRALRLYYHLGFRHRRDITFYRLRKL